MALVRNFIAFTILIAIFAGLMHQGFYTWAEEEKVGCDRLYICIRGIWPRLFAAASYGIAAAVVMHLAARMAHHSGILARLIAQLILIPVSAALIIGAGFALFMLGLSLPMHAFLALGALAGGPGDAWEIIGNGASMIAPFASAALLLSSVTAWGPLINPDD